MEENEPGEQLGEAAGRTVGDGVWQVDRGADCNRRKGCDAAERDGPERDDLDRGRKGRWTGECAAGRLGQPDGHQPKRNELVEHGRQPMAPGAAVARQPFERTDRHPATIQGPPKRAVLPTSREVATRG